MSWETFRLGDLMNLKRGYDLPASKRKPGEVPIVSSSGITGYHNISKVAGPGVVTGRYGTLGEVFYISEDFWPLNTALYIEDMKGNDPRYLAYFLRYFLSGMKSDKAAVPGVNRNDLHARVVTATKNCNIQQKIASILSTYDNLIENNRRRIQLLEKSARLLYKEWFVHLRFPGHEHVKVVDGVPEGWKKGTVGDIATVKSGYAFKSKDWQTEGRPVIKIKNIVGDNTINISDCQFVGDNIADSASKFLLKPDDMLIAMTGATVGKVGIMPITINKFYLNQRVGLFKSKIAIEIEPFLLPFFNLDYAQSQIVNLAAGAAQPNISGCKIESIDLLIPNKQVMEWYIDQLKPVFKQRQTLIEQNNKLADARDLLLPRLMNGEIAL